MLTYGWRVILYLLCVLALLQVVGEEIVAAGDAAPWLDGLEVLSPPPGSIDGYSYPIASPRTYTGPNLEHVLMPIGGIGTGTIWLDGQGRLAVWQIFNNLNETSIPDSFFAIRVKGQADPQVRILQTEAPHKLLLPMDSLVYEGGYPIARLGFEDRQLPVDITLEAFNPMIPLDSPNSSLPVAVFRFSVTNREDYPVEVSLLGSLHNAIGAGGQMGIFGTLHRAYGNNVNSVQRLPSGTVISMDRIMRESGPMKTQDLWGNDVNNRHLYWQRELGDPLALGTDAGLFYDIVERQTEEEGVALVGYAQSSFWDELQKARDGEGRWNIVLFEDFEKETYEQWSVFGNAFGTGPQAGTATGQQPVTGYRGRRLVNSFNPNDGPQGRLVSDEFIIGHRYINFLIGGGQDPTRLCVNLLVEGDVVRTATGKNQEALEPCVWEVSEFAGMKGQLEIVDLSSGGWGHINVDDIYFTDFRAIPEAKKAFIDFAPRLSLEFSETEQVNLERPVPVYITEKGKEWIPKVPDDWKVTEYCRLKDLRLETVEVLAQTAEGEPILILCPVGPWKALFGLADGLPWSWVEQLLIAGAGLFPASKYELVSGAPEYGTLCLSVDSEAIGSAVWTNYATILEEFTEQGYVLGPEYSGPSPKGQTFNGVLSVPFELEPQQSRTVTFAISWNFPNVERFGHPGNLYRLRFPDATSVASYVHENMASLWGWTKLYHDTLYQSNLPPSLLDAWTSQSVIFRGPTAFWSQDGYFGMFEGSYGSCPLNCTHVLNYAQTHARLFPDVGRNLRQSDFYYMHPEGWVRMRQHEPSQVAVDGQCAAITAAYREHLTSENNSFLEGIWPKVKLAMNWLIENYDQDRDGFLNGLQWNTYDVSISGASTFLGSQYLTALAAAGSMAHIMGEVDLAKEYHCLFERGSQNQSKQLFNGEYFMQRPEAIPGRDYNTGCHSDQLLGQWWAHMLDLGYLYPVDQVKSALDAIYRYNFKDSLHNIRQWPRPYVLDHEPGLLNCTWPHKGRPVSFVEYADEVWTGIEYAVAGLMIWEGMIEEGVAIVDAVRSRYDGTLKAGLNSGPGGNPFNELECGKFYARALSSGGLLLAAQGFVVDGPAGLLGFRPRWQPEDHRSFYITGTAWGLFAQTRGTHEQLNVIDVRYGKLSLRELQFAIPFGQILLDSTLLIDGVLVDHHSRQEETLVTLLLSGLYQACSRIEVELKYSPESAL
ncbi:MAG: GH116 family glycosyl hydrolase [Limnochordia bacterium]|jgi:uncharacterized protein (DUF608 family)